MFRHVTESKWNLKPFFKPKLKPNFSQLNCHPGVETVVVAAVVGHRDVGRLRHDLDRPRRPLEAPPLSEDALRGVGDGAGVIGTQPFGGQGTPRPVDGIRFRVTEIFMADILRQNVCTCTG